MSRILRLALLAMLLSAGAPLSAGAIEFVNGTAAAITGDTIKIGSPGHPQKTLRIWGIEAPRMGHPEELGLYARTALDDLLFRHGPNVKCVVDSFDRTTAVCRAGDTDLGTAMLLTGWAIADRTVLLADVPGGDSERSHRADAYRKAEVRARNERKGRWAGMPAQ
jgi:endonuclease YncB( thermonuclease family)